MSVCPSLEVSADALRALRDDEYAAIFGSKLYQITDPQGLRTLLSRAERRWRGITLDPFDWAAGVLARKVSENWPMRADDISPMAS